jgi:hypothetical protein
MLMMVLAQETSSGLAACSGGSRLVSLNIALHYHMWKMYEASDYGEHVDKMRMNVCDVSRMQSLTEKECGHWGRALAEVVNLPRRQDLLASSTSFALPSFARFAHYTKSTGLVPA